MEYNPGWVIGHDEEEEGELGPEQDSWDLGSQYWSACQILHKLLNSYTINIAFTFIRSQQIKALQ